MIQSIGLPNQTVSSPQKALPKIWWQGSVDTLIPIFTFLALTNWPPFFYLLSPNDPLFNDSQPIFDYSSPNEPLLGIISSNLSIEIIAKYVSKFVLCKESLPKFVMYSPFDPLFGLLTAWPLFRRKISHQKTPGFEFQSERPTCTPLPRFPYIK